MVKWPCRRHCADRRYMAMEPVAGLPGSLCQLVGSGRGSDHRGLQKMNVPYQFSESGGSILIPASQVHEVRSCSAGQCPKAPGSGFEILKPKFGFQPVSGTGQLSARPGRRTLPFDSILSAVQGARVHLAIAKPSVFTRERPQPRVSVLLNLHPGRAEYRTGQRNRSSGFQQYS
ncbi:MAG: hypothetical protein P0107_04675 [Nitrosomonas sp.]|nr:hypothetical protein [Nitrosomonas sp.]